MCIAMQLRQHGPYGRCRLRVLWDTAVWDCRRRSREKSAVASASGLLSTKLQTNNRASWKATFSTSQLSCLADRCVIDPPSTDRGPFPARIWYSIGRSGAILFAYDFPGFLLSGGRRRVEAWLSSAVVGGEHWRPWRAWELR